MSLCKMIVVPKWELSQNEWIIDKSALAFFLELPPDSSEPKFWTEKEMSTLFPKIGSESGTTKISVLWEILEHQKKQLKNVA